MKSHITNFIIWSLAVAFGWVTGRMMEMLLPVEALIGIAAVTIPLTVIIAVMIIGNLRQQKKLKSLLIRAVEKHLNLERMMEAERKRLSSAVSPDEAQDP